MPFVARALRTIPLFIVALGLAACANGGTSPTPAPPAGSDSPTPAGTGADAAAIGRAFVEALAKGDTGAAEAVEDATMRTAAPAAALAQLWGQIEGQFGTFTGIDGVETATAGQFVNATVSTSFASATVPLIVTVDAAGHVAGLHLGQPVPHGSGSPGSSAPSGSPGASAAAGSPAAPSPAAYVDPGAFADSEVTVGSAPWSLPGTLSMPVGGGPFPAVVLVAGSGPQDRDETIGPNAPLKDLAGGLASRGIAVLRYDKRTKAHAAEMQADAANVTVREETVDDAVAAVDLLRRTPGVDPGRIFVVGHSLGAFLAPRIASEAGGRVAGIGILEGNTTPLADLIVRQFEYLASDAGGADASAAAALPSVRQQVAMAESPDLTTSTPASSLPLGVPAAYWLDLRGYDAARTAAQLAIPIFISQGGRDYQVPPSELDGWRSALAGRGDVTIKEYASLDHLLIEGTGPSRPGEYLVPGHVAAQLVDDLAAWVSAARR